MDDGKQANRDQEQANANAGAPAAHTVPAMPALDPEPPPGNAVQNGAEGNPEPPHPWYAIPDWYIVILTALLVVVGAVTFRVFYRQFKEMATQTGILNGQAQQAAADSVEAAKRVERQLEFARQQAEATGKQAKASQDGVYAVKRQMRQDQRAWIKVEINQCVPESANHPYAPPVEITNIGKTAAREVNTQIIVQLLGKDEVPALTFDVNRAQTIAYSGIIFPNIKPAIYPAQWVLDLPGFHHFKVGVLSIGDVDDLTFGRKYFAVYARIMYLDVFGTHHWTHFCTTSVWTPDKGGRRLGECAAFNNVDNN